MNLGRLSINQPILAMVLSIVLLIVGAIAYTTLPVSEYPQVVPPTVVVTTQYPGASAQTVSDTVAAPIEQEINGVEDMLYLYSQATSNGQLTITVTFKLGTDLDKAQVLVQNRVAIAQPRLPEEVQRNGVVTRKNSPDILMVVFMLSPDETFDQLYISNYALLQVRDQLLRLDGVGALARVVGHRRGPRRAADRRRRLGPAPRPRLSPASSAGDGRSPSGQLCPQGRDPPRRGGSTKESRRGSAVAGTSPSAHRPSPERVKAPCTRCRHWRQEVVLVGATTVEQHEGAFGLGGRSNPDYYERMAERLAGIFPDFTLETFPERHHFDPPHQHIEQPLAWRFIRHIVAGAVAGAHCTGRRWGRGGDRRGMGPSVGCSRRFS